jgi:hypothetical protein
MEDLVEEASEIARSDNIWSAIKLSLVISNNHDISRKESNKHNWRWAEIDASVKTPGRIDNNSDEDSSDTESIPGPRPKSHDIDLKGKKKGVRFAPSFWPVQKLSTVTNSPSIDLCLRISNMLPATPGFIGAVGSSKTGVIDIHIHQQNPKYNSWSSPVSFKQLVSRPRPEHVVIPTASKLRLVLKAATSLLHLYQTPWLRKRWTTRDIHLIQGEHTNNFDEIFVLRNVQEIREVYSQFDGVFEPSVFGLGIFMIELSFDESWEQICRHKWKKISGRDLGYDQTFAADLAVIDGILQRAIDERINPEDRPFYNEGPYYLEAVHACLASNLGDGENSLKSEVFRRAVHKEIIRPLQFALQDAQKSPEKANSWLANVSIPSVKTAIDFSLFDDKVARKESLVYPHLRRNTSLTLLGPTARKCGLNIFTRKYFLFFLGDQSTNKIT